MTTKSVDTRVIKSECELGSHRQLAKILVSLSYEDMTLFSEFITHLSLQDSDRISREILAWAYSVLNTEPHKEVLRVL